jgi:hypothetical protein
VAGRRIADPFAALAHVGSWHIADKLDARFHGSFGEKLTSVSVAENLFVPPIGGLLLRVTRCPNVARRFVVSTREMPMIIGFSRD